MYIDTKYSICKEHLKMSVLAELCQYIWGNPTAKTVPYPAKRELQMRKLTTEIANCVLKSFF